MVSNKVRRYANLLGNLGRRYDHGEISADTLRQALDKYVGLKEPIQYGDAAICGYYVNNGIQQLDAADDATSLGLPAFVHPPSFRVRMQIVQVALNLQIVVSAFLGMPFHCLGTMLKFIWFFIPRQIRKATRQLQLASNIAKHKLCIPLGHLDPKAFSLPQDVIFHIGKAMSNATRIQVEWRKWRRSRPCFPHNVLAKVFVHYGYEAMLLISRINARFLLVYWHGLFTSDMESPSAHDYCTYNVHASRALRIGTRAVSILQRQVRAWIARRKQDRCNTLAMDMHDMPFLEGSDFVGLFVEVLGLTGRWDLNGQIGRTLRYVAGTSRFQVQLPLAKESVLIRSRHLKEVSNPAFLVCPICSAGDPQDIAYGCRYCGSPPSSCVAALRTSHPEHVYLKFLQHCPKFLEEQDYMD